MPDSYSLQSDVLTGLALNARTISGAMLAVLPAAVKVAFRGRSAAVRAVSDAFCINLPQEPCRFASKGARTAAWLGPDEWLLQAVDEIPEALFALLHDSLKEHSHALVDVTHRSLDFSVSGPKSEYILNHGCPLDLSPAQFPVGMCTRTVIGKAPVILLRLDISTFHVDVWRSFVPYVWQLLDEARSELAAQHDNVWVV
ncbi:sarcosine oxidase subunit gamma family protein [Bradyrhizobium sp. CW1]|uniref:sarcosine oxidase subunit gamma n=1 Tax=Bradyrhizobium sp. CW1 TaxID=2782686 RepID=UPI001FFFE2D4|nr:sarcosine oxidase subunit gamma family protein [Bradyrhizobium sp. CW1]UPJ26343.1 sarcosine oxidase subunit gamma [Bradyrhizobium sp. CW1]